MDDPDLDARIAALPSLSTAKLRLEWERLHGTPPPAGLGQSLLARGVAYKLQEQAYGGLPAAVQRELARLARQLEGSGELDVERQLKLKTGTRLVREWQGRTCHVTVLEEGFQFEERRYASLTQIAREVTGTSWSGPRFFGLRQKGRPEAQVGVHA
jgi:hypothetical protein